MEYLIRRGVPQRTAHGLVGRLVRKALDRGVRLADLPLADFQQALPGPGRRRLRRAGAGAGGGRHDQLRLDRPGAGPATSGAMERAVRAGAGITYPAHNVSGTLRIRHTSCAVEAAAHGVCRIHGGKRLGLRRNSVRHANLVDERRFRNAVAMALALPWRRGGSQARTTEPPKAKAAKPAAAKAPRPPGKSRWRNRARSPGSPRPKTRPSPPCWPLSPPRRPTVSGRAQDAGAARSARIGPAVPEEDPGRQAGRPAIGRPGRGVRLAGVYRTGQPARLQPEAEQLAEAALGAVNRRLPGSQADRTVHPAIAGPVGREAAGGHDGLRAGTRGGGGGLDRRAGRSARGRPSTGCRGRPGRRCGPRPSSRWPTSSNGRAEAGGRRPSSALAEMKLPGAAICTCWPGLGRAERCRRSARPPRRPLLEQLLGSVPSRSQAAQWLYERARNYFRGQTLAEVDVPTGGSRFGMGPAAKQLRARQRAGRGRRAA